MIKEFHKAVKKLQKFVKNCFKYPKLARLEVTTIINIEIIFINVFL